MSYGYKKLSAFSALLCSTTYYPISVIVYLAIGVAVYSFIFSSLYIKRRRYQVIT